MLLRPDLHVAHACMQISGRTMFWVTYMGGAVGGSLAHLYLTSGGSMVLGASGN